MKIGIVAPQFPPDVGGMQRYAVEVARELARRHHEVVVFTVPHAQGELRTEPYAIVPVLTRKLYLDQRIARDYSMDIWHVMTGAYSWWSLKAASPTVISVHGNDFLGPTEVTHRPWFRARYGLPCGDAMDFCVGRWMSRRVISLGVSKAAHIFTNSHYTKDVFVERYPRCNGKTSALLVGVSDTFFDVPRPPRPTGTPPRLITICRLSDPRKNVDGVLLALAALKKEFMFSYRVVGSGPLKEPLEQLAKELDVADRVRFTGYADERAVKEWLVNSDLFILTPTVLPDSREGFGITYLEANACGTPTLGVKAAGVAEAIEEPLSGYFAESASAEAVARAIRRFFLTEVVFAPDGCRTFASRFRWSGIVDQMVALYPV